jgi:hypothetical protein
MAPSEIEREVEREVLTARPLHANPDPSRMWVENRYPFFKVVEDQYASRNTLNTGSIAGLRRP